VPHEFEYFSKRRYYGEAATAPKDIYNAQVISYGSLFITILGMFILSTIIFLEYMFSLYFFVFSLFLSAMFTVLKDLSPTGESIRKPNH